MTREREQGGGEGALAGIKIVDCTRVLGGPYCTQILADHGAEVIKVEPPQGDEVRDWGPPFKDGLSAYFSGVNRNKRSISLDLTSERGRAVLLRLLAGADILIENYKAGTLESWNIGYETVLSAQFPGLVYCRITGFGADGPLGGLPGYDAAVQAWAGLISINGSEESGAMRLGIPIVDLGTGLYAAFGILAALQERSRSGRGQMVEATLFACGFALQHPHAANFFMSGDPPRLTGNAHPNISPYDLFSTRGRPLFLAVGNDRQEQRPPAPSSASPTSPRTSAFATTPTDCAIASHSLAKYRRLWPISMAKPSRPSWWRRACPRARRSVWRMSPPTPTRAIATWWSRRTATPAPAFPSR